MEHKKLRYFLNGNNSLFVILGKLPIEFGNELKTIKGVFDKNRVLAGASWAFPRSNENAFLEQCKKHGFNPEKILRTSLMEELKKKNLTEFKEEAVVEVHKPNYHREESNVEESNSSSSDEDEDESSSDEKESSSSSSSSSSEDELDKLEKEITRVKLSPIKHKRELSPIRPRISPKRREIKSNRDAIKSPQKQPIKKSELDYYKSFSKNPSKRKDKYDSSSEDSDYSSSDGFPSPSSPINKKAYQKMLEFKKKIRREESSD